MINYQVKALANGLRLITIPSNQTEAVTILILVGVGGRFEGDNQKGISHFLEHLFFKGSKKRPSTFEISKELDGIGANYNAFTGEEYTGFYVQSSRKDAEKAFDIVSDMFLSPLFDEEEIEREKGVILQESNMYRDMPQAFVQILNQKQMFGHHPLGFDLVGDAEHIKATKREDIVRYHDERYSAQNTFVVVCGNIDSTEWTQKVEKTFDLKNNTPAKAEPYKLQNIEQKVVEEIRKVDQTHFALSFLSLSKTDPGRYALTVLNTILGGGLSSRLFMQIRERRGLAYYVRSTNSPYEDIGVFSIFAGVKPDSLKEAVEIIQSEISDLVENGPNEEELSRAKGNVRGSLAISLEDSLETASFAAEEMLYSGKIRSIEEIIEHTDKVSQEDIKKLCSDILKPDRMGLSIIGPRSYREELKKILG